MGRNASAWRNEWLKLLAYFYKRVGHRDYDFVAQLFGKLANNGCRRIPRRGNNYEFATNGIRIVTCCKPKLMVGPKRNKLGHLFY
jgi:hypothetical protein